MYVNMGTVTDPLKNLESEMPEYQVNESLILTLRAIVVISDQILTGICPLYETVLWSLSDFRLVGCDHFERFVLEIHIFEVETAESKMKYV
jgi:hypothetical protein